MDALSVAVRRGQTVESRHRVHCVAVQDGRVVEAAGDGALLTFMRSAAKPLQALPLARAREDLTTEELAIACASHLARPDQLAPVRALLARAEAGEDDLECGPAGQPPRRIQHNCSGKHAGMLVVCRAQGWRAAGYRLPDHPLQDLLLQEVAAAAGASADRIATAVDGCGVVTFALPLERMASSFVELRRREGGARVVDAMRAHPDLIRGPGAPDTELMRALPGWIAKGGAEGLLCAATPDLGIAVKVEDGSARAVGPGLAGFLGRLGYDLPQVATGPVENSRGEPVGGVAAEG